MIVIFTYLNILPGFHYSNNPSANRTTYYTACPSIAHMPVYAYMYTYMHTLTHKPKPSFLPLLLIVLFLFDTLVLCVIT